ncbi:MAG: phytanoyl-CoA dioxygenase family protein [Pseudomonadales bacterium]
MAELQRIEADRVDAIVDALADDGACIALNVLGAGLCRRLLADFEGHLDAVVPGQDDLGYRDAFYGARTKRLHGLFSKSSGMVDVLTHPLFLGLGQRLFVDSGLANDLRLSNAELMVLYPDQGAQTFHTDAVSWRRAQSVEPNELLVSANCALTDFTASNGATRVVPGSHRWEPGRTPRDDEICLATMPRGSALIYTGKAIHSGGENRDPAPRVGLYLGYIVSWLKPIENHLVTNDPDDVHALPEGARRLLDVVPGGFAPYA